MVLATRVFLGASYGAFKIIYNSRYKQGAPTELTTPTFLFSATFSCMFQFRVLIFCKGVIKCCEKVCKTKFFWYRLLEPDQASLRRISFIGSTYMELKKLSIKIESPRQKRCISLCRRTQCNAKRIVN